MLHLDQDKNVKKNQQNPQKLFVVDTMAMAFRSFHAFGVRPLATSDGLPTSAVYGSLLFLLRLIERESPDYLIFASDSKEPTFRHELYPEYKANRDVMPPDLVLQLPALYELLDILGGGLFKEPGLEADDLIGSLTKQHASESLHCYIVSGDKDFMQLIDDNVFLYSPKKAQDPLIVDREGVFEKFSCAPEQVIDVLALMGDSSDNVPGVRGIGEKGAAKLVSAHGSLDQIYKNLDKVANKRQHSALETSKEIAFLSKQLVTIKTDCELNLDLEKVHFDKEATLSDVRLHNFCERMEFHSLQAKLSGGRNKASIPKSPAAAAQSAGSQSKEAKGDDVDYKGETKSLENKSLNSYQLVQDDKSFDELFTCLQNAEMFCFDTETTGLDCIADKPIGLSFSVSESSSSQGSEAEGLNKTFYIPLDQMHLRIDLHSSVAKLKSVFEDPSKEKLAHNIKFDLQMLENIGISCVGPFLDSMLAAYVIDPTRKSYKLDQLVLEELNFNKTSIADLIGKDKKASMKDVPLEVIKNYACEDADYTLRLYRSYKRQLCELKLHDLYQDLEMPIAYVLSRMEQTGMYVDLSHLDKLSKLLSEKATELEKTIYKISGEEYNINSTKQLQYIMYDKLKIQEELKIKRIKKTKTGFSTDISVLEKLSAHPLPKAILEYRTVQKLRNTYVDALPKLIHSKTQRVHSSFNQTGTATGRLSSNKPNLQNIPIRSDLGRQIRAAFTPQGEDCVILSADYSQMELRLLAHIADEPALQEAFKNGEDIHQSTASKIFGVPPNEVTQEIRGHAKAINFGIIYGMGPSRLAATTGVSMSEAKEFIEKYFEGYPNIKVFIDGAVEKARDAGYTETLLGRRRPLPELHSENRMQVVSAENIAVNTPVQGSAADMIKLAMIAVEKKISDLGLKSRLLLQVHDELVFEVPDNELEEVRSLVVECMEGVYPLKVPLKVETGAGSSWLEAH